MNENERFVCRNQWLLRYFEKRYFAVIAVVMMLMAALQDVVFFNSVVVYRSKIDSGFPIMNDAIVLTLDLRVSSK